MQNFMEIDTYFLDEFLVQNCHVLIDNCKQMSQEIWVLFMEIAKYYNN